MSFSKPITPPDFLDSGPPQPSVTIPKSEEKHFWESELHRVANPSPDFSNFTPSPEKLMKMEFPDPSTMTEETIAKYSDKVKEMTKFLSHFAYKLEQGDYNDSLSTVSDVTEDSSASTKCYNAWKKEKGSAERNILRRNVPLRKRWKRP